jgi:hypothetical protein
MPKARTVLPALIALVALIPNAMGCGPWACGVVGCYNGLRISFDGTLLPEKSYLIEIAGIAQMERGPVTTCTVGPAETTGRRVTCSGSRASNLRGGADPEIYVFDAIYENVVVVVSSGGAKLTEQGFEPVYSTDEPNGPGCPGKCIAASIHVKTPST